jgi:hypothetical protein
MGVISLGVSILYLDLVMEYLRESSRVTMLSRMKTTKSELQIMITGLIVALLAIAISCDDYYKVEDISPWTSATENSITPMRNAGRSLLIKAGLKIGHAPV